MLHLILVQIGYGWYTILPEALNKLKPCFDNYWLDQKMFQVKVLSLNKVNTVSKHWSQLHDYMWQLTVSGILGTSPTLLTSEIVIMLYNSIKIKCFIVCICVSISFEW
jgi:hypothetical protein